MKTTKIRLSVVAVLGVGILASQLASAGITNTKHNLSTSQPTATNNHLTSGTAEVCVFCHTPHGANTAFAGAPLWNKGETTATYVPYTSATLDANDAGLTNTSGGTAGMPAGVSLACLSCHDGTQAMDNMINAPGSGGYNAAGASPAGYTWTGANQTAGVLNSNSAALLGEDLTNDHPIGIEYGGGDAVAGGYYSTQTVNGKTVAQTRDTGFWPATQDVATFASWIESQTNATNNTSSTTRQKSDFPLYAEPGALTVNGNRYVECGTCHDPHLETRADGTTAATFLRVDNAASNVCVSCHAK